jgi:hypothetical protein
MLLWTHPKVKTQWKELKHFKVNLSFPRIAFGMWHCMCQFIVLNFVFVMLILQLCFIFKKINIKHCFYIMYFMHPCSLPNKWISFVNNTSQKFTNLITCLNQRCSNVL